MANLKEIKKINNSLEKECKKLRQSLEFIKTDLVLLQNGDGLNPYWNGKNAYETIKNLSLQFDNSYKLLDSIEKYINK